MDMKLLKVRIRAGDLSKGENQLMYPSAYNAVEIDRIGLGASQINQASISMSGEIGRGSSEEWCIIAMPDARADEMALDPDVEICTSEECDTLMEAWRIQNEVPEESIDSDVLNAIRAKQDAGIPLTQANLDALDPTKPEKGIRKSRRNVEDVPGLTGKITEPAR